MSCREMNSHRREMQLSPYSRRPIQSQADGVEEEPLYGEDER